MTKTQQARYDYVLKQAKKMKEYLDEGYFIFDDELSKGDRITDIFISPDGVIGAVIFGIDMEWFVPDPKYDEGVYQSLKYWKTFFSKFILIHPKDIKKLEVK